MISLNKFILIVIQFNEEKIKKYIPDFMLIDKQLNKNNTGKILIETSLSLRELLDLKNQMILSVCQRDTLEDEGEGKIVYGPYIPLYIEKRNANKNMFEIMRNQLDNLKNVSEETYKKTLNDYIEKFPEFRNFYLKDCKIE